mmetsp:Transcript_75736/g.157861  ORF Transcript_75736/g.157861 Transcript_75736/m.157861 type:complete len:557 (+) Transcript_75736:132-1802(+)
MADPAAAEISRKRIESAGPRWYHVLNLPYSASAEDVKAAYRSLVLLHHPDKGGDADTFKRIRVANEQAMAKLAKTPPKPKAKTRAAAKGKAAATAAAAAAAATASPSSSSTRTAAAESRKRPPPTEAAAEAPPTTRRASAASAAEAKRKARPKAVALSASKAKLRGAINKWENSSDHATKTMPDDITKCSADEVAEMILSKSCVLVDTRECNEGSEPETRIAGACQLTFGQVVTEPELVVHELTRLIEEPKTLVLISEKGERMGPCGLLATLLVDVFGFNEAKLTRLDGGAVALCEAMEKNMGLKTHQEWLAASTAEVSAEVKLIEAKTKLKPWREGFDEHFQVLAEGAWSAEAEVTSHLDSLSSILATLVSEESLRAMTPLAARKKVKQRGEWDKKVMSELSERFQAKLQGLEKVTQSLEAQVAALKSSAAAARKAFEEATGQAAEDGGETEAAAAADADPGAAPNTTTAAESATAAAPSPPEAEAAAEDAGDEEMEDAAEGDEADPAAAEDEAEEDDAELFAEEGEEEGEEEEGGGAEEGTEGAEGDATKAGDA